MLVVEGTNRWLSRLLVVDGFELDQTAKKPTLVIRRRTTKTVPADKGDL